ncbi:MAG: gfo/Idh/MocA family oxidoreductase [bacterium]|nr:gfo/Idh/MocA family oxidoreductase [bacterium]
MIGLDTSHVIAFSQILNDPNHPEHVPGARVVAGFPGGSPDIESSASRVDEYTRRLRDEFGATITNSIEELCGMVDGVLIENVDGRPHLEEARKVIEAGLPFFVDKPVAGSYADAVEIARLAHKAGVPWFGGSSLRWYPPLQTMLKSGELGEVKGCEAFSPISYEEHHPDLFWYGVHGVETLYTVMGRGCVSVTRFQQDSADVTVGIWNDGRIGTFRGIREGLHTYGATIYGTKKIEFVEGHTYKGLVETIVQFFQTKKPPIDPLETLELMAFMEAADQSKTSGGPAKLPEITPATIYGE